MNTLNKALYWKMYQYSKKWDDGWVMFDVDDKTYKIFARSIAKQKPDFLKDYYSKPRQYFSHDFTISLEVHDNHHGAASYWNPKNLVFGFEGTFDATPAGRWHEVNYELRFDSFASYKYMETERGLSDEELEHVFTMAMILT